MTLRQRWTGSTSWRWLQGTRAKWCALHSQLCAVSRWRTESRRWNHRLPTHMAPNQIPLEVNQTISLSDIIIALLNSPWLCGKCSSSRSPWVYMISHQISAKNSQDNMKLSAKASSVQRHCQSTMVVYMSCKKRTRLRCRCFCTTLQSPFLNTARRRTRRMLPGRKLRDLSKREINANIEIICH